MKNEYKKILGV